MKKYIKVLLVSTLLFAGISFSGTAEVCAVVRIHCGDGSGTNALVCGVDYDAMMREAELLMQTLCDQ
ncbi:MAG TPA: hypothetical protein DCY35_04285 [Prolixibacteraceae bacterium]|nr:hypothetical protein [Prolixibacteraceae bacterium]